MQLVIMSYDKMTTVFNYLFPLLTTGAFFVGAKSASIGFYKNSLIKVVTPWQRSVILSLVGRNSASSSKNEIMIADEIF